MPIDSTQQQLSKNVDSLLQLVSIPQKRSKCLEAYDINQITSYFGAQLDNDRLYNSVLQTGKLGRKKLGPAQRYAAARLLYSALLYQQSYQCNRVVRRVLNRGDMGNQIPKNILQKSQRFLYSPFIRKKLSVRGKNNRPDAADSILQLLPKTNYAKALWEKTFRHNDRLFTMQCNLFHWAGSSLFGTVGARIKDRKKQKQYAKLLMTEIQPFDILLTRSPDHWTSVFTPGYFGHASLWLGKDLVKKRKLFFKSSKKENSPKIMLREKGMVEALRSGVQVSDLLECADGEEFLILRPKNLTTEQKQKITENALKQLHKAYDFTFDIESPDMIVCTELIYLAYDFVRWDVRSVVGRYLILPDDLLRSALDNNLFYEPILIKNSEVIKSPGTDFLRSMIQ